MFDRRRVERSDRVGRGKLRTADPNFAPARQLRYRELWQHDLQVGYAVGETASFYLGVLNLSAQKPDPGNSINQPISAIGRYFYAGAKITLDKRLAWPCGIDLGSDRPSPRPTSLQHDND